MSRLSVMLRHLPSVDALVREIDSPLPAVLVTEIVRGAIDAARASLTAGEAADPLPMAEQAIRQVERARPHRVINATGVLLHTNLGRATLAPGPAELAADFSTSFGNTELDITTGQRGKRASYVNQLLKSLTGAESALVVNNTAGALLLALAAIAASTALPPLSSTSMAVWEASR